MLGCLSYPPSSYQWVNQRADTNRDFISKSYFFLFFPLSPFHRLSLFFFPRSWSSQLLSLSFYSLPDLLYSRVGYSCVQREVCVIGKAGKGTFIERPPFLVLHRFTCYVRSWIPGSPSVPLSAPPHRTLVDFSSEVPLFERVGRVLRWPWRKPVAVAVSFMEKNCRFNIVSY